MAHLHTMPGGHDVTVSALVVREVAGERRLLVHRHRKTGRTLQPGGHVEHTENIWQALAHELAEETGYGLAELELVQALAPSTAPEEENLPLPVPFAHKVHEMTPGHYHDDLIFAFVAAAAPAGRPAEGESSELWWASAAELDADPLAPAMLATMLRDLVGVLPSWPRVPAAAFSVGAPPPRGTQGA